MNINFELILFYAVVVSGIIALFDLIFLAKKRKEAHVLQHAGAIKPPAVKLPLIIEYAWSFFPILLLVFLLRSFLFEPFRIPSGSLEPTLQIGDFVLVNKFDYGVRLPVIHQKVSQYGEPKRGDIFVFRYPPDPSVNFIKRVIGLPGDHIKYVDKVLYINGEKMPQTFIENSTRLNEDGRTKPVAIKEEDLLGVKHKIYQNIGESGDDFDDIVVPPNMYFAMGDNRDDSADSRYWGFVPESNIVGKAVLVWMSWNSTDHNIRWKRLIKPIQ
jgi:signal peptidase I